MRPPWKLTVMGDSPWIRVATRLEPASKLELRQFSDRLKFAHRPDWAFSPSVGSDGIVDVAAARAVGVNGLNMTECSVDAGRIQLSISSPYQWKRPPVIVFRRLEPSRRYQVFVNGNEAGSWRGEDLERGISLLPHDALAREK